MSRSRIHAQLVPESPFYDVFPGGKVPLREVHLPLGVPVSVELIGCPEQDVYLLDWKACSDRQRELVADRVARLRGGAFDQVLEFMAGGGDMPIRVSQTSGVTITSDLRAFM